MPDVTRKTISATESPGLFGVSPYVTRWMLFQKFAKGIDLDNPADARMTWGKKLQPLIIEQAAEDLALEIRPNADDDYHRRGLLGCTRDATIICPSRGPGALETKCVFDYATWMSDWGGGRFAPRHYEIQLQQQMLVGDPEFAEVGEIGPSYTWGVICAWVAGEQHYLQREPIPELWERLNESAAQFFSDVQAGNEPTPFGAPIEIEWLVKLYPLVRGKVIDLSGEPDADKHADAARLYVLAKAEENGGKRTAAPLRAKLLALAMDAEEVILPEGIRVRIGGNEKSKRLDVYVPEAGSVDAMTPPKPSPQFGDLLNAG